jgi:hypothetical protein
VARQVELLLLKPSQGAENVIAHPGKPPGNHCFG